MSEENRGFTIVIGAQGKPLEDIEREALIGALRMSQGIQVHAALLLGISPRVMSYKIKILGIDLQKIKGDSFAPREIPEIAESLSVGEPSALASSSDPQSIIEPPLRSNRDCR